MSMRRPDRAVADYVAMRDQLKLPYLFPFEHV